MANTKKNNDLAIQAPKTAAELPKTIELLENRLKTLKGNHKDNISLDIQFDDSTNIKDVQKVGELMEISASVNYRNDAFNNEVKRYNLEGRIKPFSVSGKTVEEWNEIIAKAVNELINKNEIVKIQTAITELSGHLDKETKLQKTLASIVGNATQLLD